MVVDLVKLHGKKGLGLQSDREQCTLFPCASVPCCFFANSFEIPWCTVEELAILDVWGITCCPEMARVWLCAVQQ